MSELATKIREMQPRPPVYTSVMYHGTRTAWEAIFSEGLRPLTYEEGCGIIEQFLRDVDVTWEDWKRYYRGDYASLGPVGFRDQFLTYSTHTQVWVTEYFLHAAQYAQTAPEVISNAMDSILKFKYGYYRLRSSIRQKAMDERIRIEIRMGLHRLFGFPKVCIVDVRGLNIIGDINTPLPPPVPVERIRGVIPVITLPKNIDVLEV